MQTNNPFAVTTPETLSADAARSLFVQDVPGYRHLREPGHAFLNGARGSGKSMIFRYLEPDCQLLENNCALTELPFLALYIPNKSPQFRPTELVVQELSPAHLLYNEHALSLHVLKHVFKSLFEKVISQCADEKIKSEVSGKFRQFIIEEAIPRFQNSMWRCPNDIESRLSGTHEMFRVLDRIISEMTSDLANHFKKQLSAGSGTLAVYEGPIIGFSDVVAPLIEALVSGRVFGSGKIYLLLDDADELSLQMTQIMNNWLFARTTGYLSLKLSTAFRYRSFLTTSGRRVETPHDFAEINISDIYTSDKFQGYKSRVIQIAAKRLKAYNIDSAPEAFFPSDCKQDVKIAEIYADIKKRWKTDPKGSRDRDDAYRYARADYIAGLGGARKQSSKFSYSGLDMLIDISSGVVREFLEAATQMYDQASSKRGALPVDHIPPAIQSQVVRARATAKIMTIENELSGVKRIANCSERDVAVVKNLVMGLGSLFREILKAKERSERRVFSFALSDEPDQGLLRILDLAIELGLLQTSSIGRKSGFGRTRLYVLTRLIAPEFNLDPGAFAGYKFLTTSKLRELMQNPTTVANLLKRNSASYFVDGGEADLFSTGASAKELGK